MSTQDERDAEAARTHDNANRGDVLVHGFWRRQTPCVIDLRVTDTECRSYRNQDPEKLLKKAEEEKKAKHLEACQERRRHFTPLVYSVDGMAGSETKAAEKRLAALLAFKWKREYSEMVGYVRARMALSIVRANTLLIRGTRERRMHTHASISDGAAMMGWQTWNGW